MGWSFIENYKNIDVNNDKLSNIDTIATFCDKGQKLNKTSNSCDVCPVNEFQGDTHHRKTSCIKHGDYTSDMCDDNTYFFKTNTEVNDKIKLTKTMKLSKSDVCSAWTSCEDGYYQTAGGTDTTDRECSAWTLCQDGYYQTNTPNDTTNRTCSARRTKCPNGEYQTAGGTDTTDITCSPWSTCTNNTYRSTEGTSTTDTICSSWRTPCPPGKEQTTAPTPTANRVCSDCPSGKYKTNTGSHNCQSQPRCATERYVSLQGSASSRRECTLCPDYTANVATINGTIDDCLEWTKCPSGQYNHSARANNRGSCKTCNAGTWKTGHNINQCVAHTNCVSNPNSLGGYYKTLNPSSTSDMACTRNSTGCTNGQPCPVDCVGGFGGFSDCSPSCGKGSGRKTQTYYVTRDPAHNGEACPYPHGWVNNAPCSIDRCRSGH